MLKIENKLDDTWDNLKKYREKLPSIWKKKKVKDTRQYRSRNDIEFSDCESLDEPSSGDEDEE